MVRYCVDIFPGVGTPQLEMPSTGVWLCFIASPTSFMTPASVPPVVTHAPVAWVAFSSAWEKIVLNFGRMSNGRALPVTCNQREIYQSPACIYRERSINRRHVYTKQTASNTYGLHAQAALRPVHIDCSSCSRARCAALKTSSFVFDRPRSGFSSPPQSIRQPLCCVNIGRSRTMQAV